MCRSIRRMAGIWRACPVAITFLLLACSTRGSVDQQTADAARRDTPAWPTEGVAQVEFEGDQMFVERIGDRWHAWVVAEASTWTPGWNVETDEPRTGAILDFFSGKQIRAFPGSTPDGIAYGEFTTLEGRRHAPARIGRLQETSRFKSQASPHFGDLEIGDGIRSPDRARSRCPLQLVEVRREAADKSAVWRKVVLYRDPPSRDCPDGSWNSYVFTALDLGDGTFLATTPRYVVRLSLHDLRPVGTVSNLHVLDAAVLERLLADARPASDADVHVLLNRLLLQPARDAERPQ